MFYAQRHVVQQRFPKGNIVVVIQELNPKVGFENIEVLLMMGRYFLDDGVVRKVYRFL